MSKNRHGNKDSRRFHTWLDNAQEDLIAAGLIIDNPRCYKLVAFHCHQVLEKVLKAYMLFKKNKLMDGHNLLWLCQQAAKIDNDFVDFFDECVLINHCYIETRYPSDLLFEIEKEQAEEIFSSTKQVFETICSKIYQEYII